MKRLLVAAALAATAAANLVLLSAFLDVTRQNRKLATERANHRCPSAPLIHESRPSAAFFERKVQPEPIKDPAQKVEGAVSKRV